MELRGESAPVTMEIEEAGPSTQEEATEEEDYEKEEEMIGELPED